MFQGWKSELQSCRPCKGLRLQTAGASMPTALASAAAPDLHRPTTTISMFPSMHPLDGRGSEADHLFAILLHSPLASVALTITCVASSAAYLSASLSFPLSFPPPSFSQVPNRPPPPSFYEVVPPDGFARAPLFHSLVTAVALREMMFLDVSIDASFLMAVLTGEQSGASMRVTRSLCSGGWMPWRLSRARARSCVCVILKAPFQQFLNTWCVLRVLHVARPAVPPGARSTYRNFGFEGPVDIMMGV
jgi:hypothetical protein